MGWLDDKLSKAKKSVSDTISKASESVADLDIKDAASGLAIATTKAATVAATKAKELSVNAYSQASESVADLDFKDAASSLASATTKAATIAKDASIDIYTVAKEQVSIVQSSTTEAIYSFDYTELTSTEIYTRNFSRYKDISVSKVSELYRSTFEVDKTTIEMVEGIRKRLPVPVDTVDEIFEQCKREAMQRAISAFALGGIMQDIDNHSALKYENLSDRYSSFAKDNAYQIKASAHFANMINVRNDASTSASFLQDGYNSSNMLDPAMSDIEHVISKKEYYVDPIIRIGTTNDQFFDLINSQENLVFADHSLNRSMGSQDILEYLQQRGRPVYDKPGVVAIDIMQQDGTIKTVEVIEADMVEAYSRASEKRDDHRLAALREVGQTIALTGAAMAAQHVVGLIVLETIDVFVDEIKLLATKGRIMNDDGWIQNSKDAADRIQARLTQRFEEREIWARAKKLGLEAGVSGALSIIPQILVSLIIKIPSFVLGLIRECTLSVVRCVRVLLSDDPNKLDSMKVLLAGSASAIAGLYVGRAVSTAISGVPLLNRFNAEITGVLTGVVVTAVPLTAIYTFEQNKNRLTFLATTEK